MLRSEGAKIPSFKEDFVSLANGRFHMTLMAIPLIGVLLFTVLPLIYMICLAFTNFDHNHLPPKSLFDWVGLSNFGNVLSGRMAGTFLDRKSTRLNSSHANISYAVFCLK